MSRGILRLLLLHVLFLATAEGSLFAEGIGRCVGDQLSVEVVIEDRALELDLHSLPSPPAVAPGAIFAAAPLRSADKDALLWLDNGGRVQALELDLQGNNPPVELATVPGGDKDYTLAVGDFDGDGRGDLLVHRSEEGMVYGVSAALPQATTALGTAAGQALGTAYLDDKISSLVLVNGDRLVSYSLTSSRLGPPRELLSIPNLDRLPREAKVLLGNLDRRHSGTMLFFDREHGITSWHAIRPIGKADRPGQYIHAQFFPLSFRWESNYSLADLNGDMRADLLVLAPESRQFWAAVSVEGGAYELELNTTNLPVRPLKILATGRFLGRAAEDLLLAGESLKRWWLASPGAARLGAGKSIEIAGGRYVTDQRGKFCLPRAAADSLAQAVIADGGELVLSEATDVTADRVRLIFKPPAKGNGARFSVGRHTAGPYVCTGYQPDTVIYPNRPHAGKWRSVMRDHFCAANYAFYFATDAADAAAISALSPNEPCCPLPAENILSGPFSGPESRTMERCPPKSVVVGTLERHGAGGEVELLCAGINATRYRLGPETPGVYWGHGFSAMQKASRMRRNQIPAAIRAAAGRFGLNQWHSDGCVGDPPGSLLTGRDPQGRGCGRWKFRRLLYIGAPGQPPDGTPVTMFPDCEQIMDSSLPTAHCSGGEN